jgi:hypothetical protein
MQILPNGKTQFIDATGAPLVGGMVYFYAPGTANPVNTYKDSGGSIPNTNPVVLDSNGQATIWGSGTFRQVVQNAAGVQIWDQLVSSPAGSGDLSSANGASFVGYGTDTLGALLFGKLNRVVDSIASLRAISKLLYTRVFVTGYYGVGDGGGGEYYYDPSDTSSADNGGSIILAADNARWKLVIGTEVCPEQFGAKGNGTGNDAPAINAALTAVGVVKTRPNATYRITQPVLVPYGAVLEGPGKGLFTGVRYQTFGTQGFYHPQGVSAIAVDFGSGNTNEANSAVQLASQSTVQGISFYYPSQSAATLTPTPYPPTIALTPGTQSNVASQTVTTPSVVSCHFCNPYRAISFSQIHNSGFVSQCTGYAYDNFAFFDQSNDTNRMNDCQINAVYSYYGDFPANSMLSYQYAGTTSEAIRCGRADAMEFNNNYVFGFYKGLSLNVFNTGSPNGIFINGGGFEGSYFPVVMATLFRRITLRGVQFGSFLATGATGGGPAVSIGQPTNSGITSEVRLIGCTSFASYNQAVVTGNVNGISIVDCEWYNSNQQNQGFATAVMNFLNGNTIKVIGNTLEQNSGNANGYYIGIVNCNGVIISDNTYVGQLFQSANISVTGSNAVRCTNNIEQKVSSTSFGTGVIFSSSSQTFSDGYIQY